MGGMGLTVHDVRNGIRGGVGRFKREDSYPFTKEELAAIAVEVGCQGGGSGASKESMRAGIRREVGLVGQGDVGTGTFRRKELLEIADVLGVEPVEGDEPDPLF